MTGRDFSKIWIIVIVVIIATGGILAWQNLGVIKLRLGIPRQSTSPYTPKLYTKNEDGGKNSSQQGTENKCEKETVGEEIETENLTLNTLKNTEYYSLFLEKIIKLTNGFYSEPPPEPSIASHCEIEIYKDKITLGDLNNDGKDDAGVILDGTCGGSGCFRELAIIINKNGKPYYLTSKDLGDRVIIKSMTIKLGVITLDMVVHTPEDGMCCPSLEKIFKYKLSGNQLVEVQ